MRVTRQPASQPCKNSLLYTTFLPFPPLSLSIPLYPSPSSPLFYALLGSAQRSVVILLPTVQRSSNGLLPPPSPSPLSSSPKADKNGPDRVERRRRTSFLLLPTPPFFPPAPSPPAPAPGCVVVYGARVHGDVDGPGVE